MPIARAVRRTAITPQSDEDAYDEAPEVADSAEEETERPRRFARRSADDEAPRRAAEDSPRRSTTEDGPRRKSESGGSIKLRGGFGASRQLRERYGNFPARLKITDEAQLIKFLDEEPFVAYAQHWFDELTGQKGFVCAGDRCPLCDVLNDRPMVNSCFNVVTFETVTEKGQTFIEPQVKMLQAGSRMETQLQGIAEKNGGTLSDGYFSVYKSGKQGTVAYTFQKVKERDLPDDWEMDPLTEDELAELRGKRLDESAIPTTSIAKLREIAESLSSD